jgi:hypothetical protein
MTVYHLCDICRIRMSKFIVEIKETKDNIMNDKVFEAEREAALDELVSADQADAAIAEAVKKALEAADAEAEATEQAEEKRPF